MKHARGCCRCWVRSITPRPDLSRPSSISKTRRNALIIGTLCAGVILTLANAFIVFPLYVRLFGMTTEQLVQMAVVVNPLVTDLVTMMFFSILPFNLFKYGVTSMITWFTYKRVFRVVKG